MRIIRPFLLSLYFSNIALAIDIGVGVKVAMLYNTMPSSGLDLSLKFNDFFGVVGSAVAGSVDFKSAVQSATDDDDATSTTTTESVADVKTAEISQTLTHLAAQWFPAGGSFFVSFGLGVGKIVGDVKIESKESDDLVDEEITYDTTYFTATLGNIWRFKWFYVGGEWGGFTGVISNSKKESSNSSESLGTEIKRGRKDFDDTLRIYGERGGGTLLVLNAGVMF